MSRSASIIITLIFAAAAFGQVPATQPTPAEASVSCAVSVVHTIDVQKMLEVMREQQKLRVGVAGTAPPFIYNITTGMIVDDQGHVVTRLANLDPQDKDHKLLVATSDGRTLSARLIGVDFATGFAVLEVASLTSSMPKIAAEGSLSNGSPVKILSSDVVQKAVIDKVYLAPAITVSQGQVLIGSLYSRARGAMTLQSKSLLARRDGSVVVTADNQVIGIAQYAGFGRAYLYPIAYVRDTIAKRVIEKKDNVPAGWLGVRGDSVAELPEADISALGLQRRAGVIIRLVSPESAAAQAGILQGDVITRVEDFDVAGTADLRAFLSQFPAGQSVKLRALRDHKPVEITAVLGARPTPELQDLSALLNQSLHPELSQREQLERRYNELVARYREYQSGPPTKEAKEALTELTIEIRQIFDSLRALGPENTGPPPKLATTPSVYPGPALNSGSDVSFSAGFTAREMTPQFAEWMQARNGVLVTMVAAGSPAERAGLKTGDVIVGTEGRVLLSIPQLQAFLSSQRGTVILKVIRTKEPVVVSLLIQ